MPLDRTSSRRTYIDWARGVAVLLMVEAHTLDAWTRLPLKRLPTFGSAMVLGGFAAPLFLWLAGLATALSAARLLGRLKSRSAVVEAICRRGLEIFILAFLFRVQAFIVSPGSHVLTIFRVDILNIMGPAIVAAGLLWALAVRPGTLIVVYAAAAGAIAMVTPLVRATVGIEVLPVWLQWYLRPSGEYTTFTAFPWVGFVFAGAAVGTLLTAAKDAGAERRTHLACAAVGVALVAFGWYTSTRPSIYAHAEFWSSSPTWFAMRVGIVMAALSFLYGAQQTLARVGFTCEPLARFGRNSLFIYWIHVELVYGYASWLWRGRMPVWGAVLACGAFSICLYGAVLLKDHVVQAWQRTRPVAENTPRLPQADRAMVS